MLKRLFIIGAIVLFTGSSFAATAGDTSDPKLPYGPGVANMQASGLGPFKVSFDADCILDKDLDNKSGIADAEMTGQWYLFRIGYTFADRVEPYVKLGGSHLKACWKEGSTHIKARGEDGFAVGIGGKVHIYELPDYRIKLSLDGQYLYTDPDVKQAYVNDPNRSVTATEFKVSEWQIAGIISMEFPLGYDKANPASISAVVPYIGLAYFDSNTKVKFTYSGTEYSLDNTENENKFLLITGCDVLAPQNVSLNVEGRWIGETAGSGGVTFKF